MSDRHEARVTHGTDRNGLSIRVRKSLLRNRGVTVNLAFLGDAFDHWKGSLFESLHGAGIIRGFSVDPMTTDSGQWEQEDVALYARLLRIQRSQLIQHTVSLADDREVYFAEIRHSGDLFLDPDTGVATSAVRKPERYVTPAEIGQLLNAQSGRLVIVYQHVRAQHVAARVDSVLNTIGKEVGAISWSSYESGTVAILFVSRESGRTTEVAGHFRSLLGRHANNRIREGRIA